ncbi:ABC transporter permease [Chryseolinea sp. T2]|uniref:ABC transporter permease n=1 Tax=Chryseolinea sp. T2 TaxID=3129255 RepID=UPI0030789098
MSSWLTTVLRSFLKHKSFTLLNAGGLLFGLGCFTAILLYVVDELKFDRFHDNASRIYRINVTTSYDGAGTRYPTTAAPLAEFVARDIPEVEHVARLFGREASLQPISEDSSLVADKKFREPNFYFADPSTLKLFTFSFLAGNSSTALDASNKIVLSRRTAEKYFGSATAAINKLLMFEGSIPMVVSAVYEDWPLQSSNIIDAVAHFDNYYAVETPEVRDFLKRDWLYNPLQTYVMLRPAADPVKTTSLIQKLNERYADERVRDHVIYSLQPITDIHLRSDFTHASDRNAIRYIYIFLAIGVLILLIACINFINLSTVHSMRRAKEIGVRKVVGASRFVLFWHYMSESLLLTVLSGGLAMGLLYYALPLINGLTGKSFDSTALFGTEVLFILIPIILITGLTSGIYPSLFVSRINPVSALKGLKTRIGTGHFLVRRILVAAQFTASIALIAFTLVIQRQIHFMQDKPLGFNKEFVLTVPVFSSNPNSILGGGVGRDLRLRMNGFETEIGNTPSVKAVTVSSTLPGQGAVFALVTTDSIRDTDNLFVPIVSVDYDFLETYDMQVIAGRAFDRTAGTDHLNAFMANEEALSVLGFGDARSAIGKQVNAFGKNGTLIGVIRNFHVQGLQQPLRPLLMEVDVSKFTVFSVRLDNTNVSSSIEAVKTAWNKSFPERVFEYRFLDDQLMEAYQSEQRFGSLIGAFSLLAIGISSLGLLGLAAYVNIQRQKEAGIRKVLGASTIQVFYALSKEFALIFGIAAFIAMPLSYYLSAAWLATFANQVGIGWIPLMLALFITFAVILFTTAVQTIRTASVNPVQTIRNE